jgi:hypothetical protein
MAIKSLTSPLQGQGHFMVKAGGRRNPYFSSSSE